LPWRHIYPATASQQQSLLAPLLWPFQPSCYNTVTCILITRQRVGKHALATNALNNSISNAMYTCLPDNRRQCFLLGLCWQVIRGHIQKMGWSLQQ
jgi:hypothetical protein